MPKMFKIMSGFVLLLNLGMLLTPKIFAVESNEIAYRFTDTDPADEEEDEYFDAYGNRIYDSAYREQHRIQSETMQKEASKPFGLAGNEFGKSWGTSPLKKDKDTKKEEDSEEKNDESDEKKSLKESKKVSAVIPLETKRKVLVS